MVGGAVPWLLLSESDMPHIGTADVDLSLNVGDGEYVRLVESGARIITYLDLWNGNDRDREAAEYVAREFFPWLE